MSNQIRPVSRVFEPGDAVVLEIATGSALSAYTWVVIAQDPIAEGDQVAAHGSRPKSGTRKPPASASVTVSSELATGDYLVRLLVGKPARPDDLASFLASAELLDEDTFSVSDEGVDAATGMQATRVTNEMFGSFLAALWGHEDQRDDTRTAPAFGSMTYETLRDAAREFVGQATVSQFRDLLPSEYPEGRIDDTTLRLPQLVGLPVDPPPANLPAVELIWNYWLEEGMLVQTLERDRGPVPEPPPAGARSRSPASTSRRCSRCATGCGVTSRTRCTGSTVRRRAAEYEYEYGLSLVGRAVPRPDNVVERRSGFVETFHQVLFLAHRYFKELDDLDHAGRRFPAVPGTPRLPHRALTGHPEPVRRDGDRGPRRVPGDADASSPNRRCASSSAAGR